MAVLTVDPRDAADRLWDAAGPDGAVWQVGLPKPVLIELQRVVDTAVWQCEHVEAAADLPPAVVPKLCVAGGRAISCLQPACLLTMHDVSYGRRLTACVFCHHKLATYDQVLFTDAAAGLTMAAAVCWPCARPGGPLADWAGLPDH